MGSVKYEWHLTFGIGNFWFWYPDFVLLDSGDWSLYFMCFIVDYDIFSGL